MLLRPRWFSPTTVWVICVLAAGAAAPILAFVGPSLSSGFVWLALSGAVCPLWFDRVKAALVIVTLIVALIAGLAWNGHFPAPAGQAIFAVGMTLIVASILDWTISAVRRLAIQERLAHRQLEAAHGGLAEALDQLADLNSTLEERVAAQVGEIEGLGRLRRFLSPQVAEAILTDGNDAVLRAHRQRIAVFFCDLRGFTAFTSGAEPEEVVEALDDYYRAVGQILHSFGATVGSFAGDGIMAYLNDPVPCEDPAGVATAMALAMDTPMAGHLEAWRRRGLDLGYGVGIAYGYATLGTVGFEGRSDYTALGSVVNLAARLCAEAAAGEVLIDTRTADALGDRFHLAAREVTLKGFSNAIRAYEVIRAK